QAIEELLNGTDLDHLVAYRLHPNRVAIGFRLLARNLAIGYQLHQDDTRPAPIREPRAFRATAVEGLGTFTIEAHGLVITPLRSAAPPPQRLPWSQLTVQYAGPG